jgi:acetyl esterase/lipase
LTAVLALGLALVVLAIAPWAHVPAPHEWLLPLTVGAPELSVWLLATSWLSALLATVALVRRAPRRRLAFTALLMATLGGAFPLWVLSSISSHAGFLEEVWRETYPATPTLAARPHPYTWREMFIGLEAPPVRVRSGIPMASPGGVALAVDVYRPDDDALVPVVVQIYGGGWRNGTPGKDATMARALAASGFAVFAIDYRHTPDWRWPAQLDDVLDGIEWVSTHASEYNADATRMGLIGRSAGAQLAMRASQDDRLPGVDAVVTLYGPVDLVEGHRSPPVPDPLDVRRVEEALFGARPDERLDAYVDASPITRAGRSHPPVLVVTAGRDKIVEPHFGALLHQRLARSGVSVLLELPWADHAFDAVPFGPSAQIALHYTQRFFSVNLRR